MHDKKKVNKNELLSLDIVNAWYVTLLFKFANFN